jgi:L-fuculose-phosphate aldolase
MTAKRSGFVRQRRDIVAACRRMNALGINQGTSGNIGVRVNGGLLITPSGMPYEELTPADIVFMRADGTVPKGQREPSTEWRFHHDIFAKRPDAGAVVHTHAMFATTLACLGKDIPAFHYMVAKAGGNSIRCAPYATFGTQELSDHALKALDGRKACLLANHGMIALGETLKDAMALAVEAETLAGQYWRALQLGKPKILSAAEMRRVIAKFSTYGKQPR